MNDEELQEVAKRLKKTQEYVRDYHAWRKQNLDPEDLEWEYNPDEEETQPLPDKNQFNRFLTNWKNHLNWVDDDIATYIEWDYMPVYALRGSIIWPPVENDNEKKNR